MDYLQKYIKYKNKYLEFKKNQKGGLIITMDDLKKVIFLKYIQQNTKNFFNEQYESGGIINFINNKYEIILTNKKDKDGMILYPEEMLKNIKENQIIWHTHNIKREFKCEPPSGNDIVISIDLAAKNIYPYSIAIHTNGIWIYKINKLNEKMICDLDNYKRFVYWYVNTLNTLFCCCDINKTIIENEINIDDFQEYNITTLEMKSLQDYYNNFNKIFKDYIYIEYIEFP